MVHTFLLRLTKESLASSAWVIFFFTLSTLMLFFIINFFKFPNFPIKSNDEKDKNCEHVDNHYIQKLKIVHKYDCQK